MSGSRPEDEDAASTHANGRPGASYSYRVEYARGCPVATTHGAGCLAITGYSPEDYTTDPGLWLAMVHPDDRQHVQQQLAAIEGGAEAVPIEHRIRTRAGGLRWVRNTLLVLRDDAGRIERYEGLVEDITERRRVEARYRTILEATPEALVVVNAEGRMLFVNERTETQFGYERSELLGQEVEKLLPERLAARHAELREAYRRAPRARPMAGSTPLLCRRKDGSEFPGQISLNPIETEEGLLVAASIRDLTDHLRLEDAVATNLLTQNAINRVLQASLTPIALDELLGLTLDLILAVPWFASQSRGAIFLVADEGPTLRLRVERGQAASVETEVDGAAGLCPCGERVAHGEIVFAAAADAGCERPGRYCVPIQAEGQFHGVIQVYPCMGRRDQRQEEETFLGSVARVLALALERCGAEAALKESEERFRPGRGGTNAGIWDWDLRTNRVYFSPRWKTMLGHTVEEIEDRFSEWYERLHPEDRDRAFATIRDYLEGRSVEYELEHRLRHKNGSYRWIMARGAAVRDGQNQPYRMVGSHIDITEHKEAMELLQDNLVQFEAAQRIQQSLLPAAAPQITGLDIAGISHPAEFAGGDLFDYLPMLGGGLGILVGDVSGHGISSALLMAGTQAYLRCLSQTCATVAEVLTRANRFVFDETDYEHYVTLLLLRYNPRNRQLVYANAGHPAGYVIDASGQIKAELDSSSIPLGILESVEFPVREAITLAVGDLILLLTDGILEAEAPGGGFFGVERAIEVVSARRDLPAAEILEALHQAVIRHTGTPLTTDDLTAVVVKVER